MDKEKLEEGFCKKTINDETLTKANAILVIKCANLEQQCKKQKEVIDMFLNKVEKNKMLLNNPDLLDLYLKIKEVSE